MTRSFSRLRARLGLRRTARPGGTSRRAILLYHRIAAPAHDPFALAVQPTWFEDHLGILATRSRLVGLAEMLAADPADPTVLTSITFDDGYADNLAVAAPMLRAAGIPATYFVCTGALGDDRGFWWDRLASAIAATDAPAAVLDGLDGIPPVGALTTEDDRTRATLAIAARLQPLPPAARDQLLEEIETRLPPRAGASRARCPILDEAGLRDLASQPLTEIGAHTEHHPMLSRLTPEEQRDEIAGSIATITDVTGTRPRFGAYPYGAQADYDDDSCRAAADAGLRAAFVNHGGRFDPTGDPYRVPRTYVPPVAADGFRTWLDGILAR